MILRTIFITAGTLCLFIGVVGIFLPGLPTTPFLLLTAGFYVRGSKQLYDRLLLNPYLGKYIIQWQTTRKLPLRTKITAIVLMWIMISLSVLFLLDSPFVRWTIILTGLAGTVVMGFLIPTDKK